MIYIYCVWYGRVNSSGFLELQFHCYFKKGKTIIKTKSHPSWQFTKVWLSETILYKKELGVKQDVSDILTGQ